MRYFLNQDSKSEFRDSQPLPHGLLDRRCVGLRPNFEPPPRVKTLLSPMSADTWGQEMVWEWDGYGMRPGPDNVGTDSHSVPRTRPLRPKSMNSKSLDHIDT